MWFPQQRYVHTFWFSAYAPSNIQLSNECLEEVDIHRGLETRKADFPLLEMRQHWPADGEEGSSMGGGETKIIERNPDSLAVASSQSQRLSSGQS